MASEERKVKTLYIKRKWMTEESTIGELYDDRHFLCYTLEDAVRPTKIYGKTAIPAGTYKVVLDFSQRFQRIMPHVLDVPGFEGIRIHAGNTAADTEGCILVGLEKGKNYVLDSRKAFEQVFYVIQDAIEHGEAVELDIS